MKESQIFDGLQGALRELTKKSLSIYIERENKESSELLAMKEH